MAQRCQHDAVEARMSVSEFDQFWAVYPKREKKQAARDWFRWAMQRHNQDGQLVTRILATVTWQKAQHPDVKYWQQPDKWLSGMRWEDEPPVEIEDAEMAKFLAGEGA